jgi:RND family efflux transporter MFP subunit
MVFRRAHIYILVCICLLAGPGKSQETEKEYVGLIEPYRVVNVGSPQIGVLATVDVDRGDMVKKGQIIATLQSDVEEAALEVARYRTQMEAGVEVREVNMELAERKRIRYNQLYEDELIPFSDMDEVETTKRLTEKQLSEAKENKELADYELKQNLAVVERMTIRSPIDGVVMERFLHPGEHIENEAILKIAQINPLNVEMILPIALYGNFKVGMRAWVIPEAPINGRYNAVVEIVDKVIDGASGTFGVRLELWNQDYKLPAGVKCKVIFP